MKIQDTQKRKYKTDVVDIRKHYTPESAVKDLLSIIPISQDDVVIDAGSGENKVWFNNLNVKKKMEYEIEDGTDFLMCYKRCDWVVGNPPYHISWQFAEKSFKLSCKGVAFLLSINSLNSFLTPKRMTYAEENGFYITKIHVLSIKRWFGRYFLIIYEKNKPAIISYSRKNYE